MRRVLLCGLYALGLYGTAFFPIPAGALRALHAESAAVSLRRRRLLAVIARQAAEAPGLPAGHPERLLTGVPLDAVERPLWQQLDLGA